MVELDKQEKVVVSGNKEEEEGERLLDRMAVLDFDMLCSTVVCKPKANGGNLKALRIVQNKETATLWRFEDARRFGKNMRRGGFGYCFLQESRALEINNVQDGTWHGRGDICIGNYEGSKAFIELLPPPLSVKTAEPCSMQNSLNGDDNG